MSECPRGALPTGRPADGEDRPPMRQIHFLAPPEVADALDELTAGVEQHGAQSIVIRQAILEKLERHRAGAG